MTKFGQEIPGGHLDQIQKSLWVFLGHHIHEKILHMHLKNRLSRDNLWCPDATPLLSSSIDLLAPNPFII